jgi:enamine deaminase RidA (YjgF/YER057c/UK114 family)
MARVTYVDPPGTAPAQGNYSHVGIVQGGRMAYVAGQLAVGAKGEVVGKDDFEAQFAQVFRNLGDVLRGLEVDFNSVVKFTTYMVHSQDLEKFMAQRKALFPKLFKTEAYPPNTLLMIDRLVKEEFLIEVEAVVALPEA